MPMGDDLAAQSMEMAQKSVQIALELVKWFTHFFTREKSKSTTKEEPKVDFGVGKVDYTTFKLNLKENAVLLLTFVL